VIGKFHAPIIRVTPRGSLRTVALPRKLRGSDFSDCRDCRWMCCYSQTVGCGKCHPRCPGGYYSPIHGLISTRTSWVALATSDGLRITAHPAAIAAIMGCRSRSDPLNFLGRATVRKEPLGVTLIIGAWNFPITLL
jgi:hypothetical protein